MQYLCFLAPRHFPGLRNQQRGARFSDGRPRAVDAYLFHHIVGITQAGGIDQMDGYALKMNSGAHMVPGRAWNRRHNRQLIPRQAIQQTGFAHIWPTDQHDGEAIPKHRALLGLQQQCRMKCT